MRIVFWNLLAITAVQARHNRINLVSARVRISPAMLAGSNAIDLETSRSASLSHYIHLGNNASSATSPPPHSITHRGYVLQAGSSEARLEDS